MLKFVIGPVLTGAAYLAGSIYGSSAEQIVNKPPAAVYSELAGAVGSMAERGIMRFDDGTTVPYDLSFDGTPDQRLVIRLATGGRQMASADVLFTPEADGSATKLTLKVDADNQVLREAFAETPKARIGYAPDWMFNLAMKPVLRGAAGQIERGAGLRTQDWIAGQQQDPRAGWSADQRRAEQEWQQYDASRPMVDPNASAHSQMQGSN